MRYCCAASISATLSAARQAVAALKAAHPDVRLHLIGPLQRNKVRRALRLFDVIEVIDTERLARALADAMAETGLRPDLLIEVNTGEEEQKSGVAPLDADA